MIYLEKYLHRVYQVVICADGGPCMDPGCGEEHAVIDVVPLERASRAEMGRDQNWDTVRRLREENRRLINERHTGSDRMAAG